MTLQLSDTVTQPSCTAHGLLDVSSNQSCQEQTTTTHFIVLGNNPQKAKRQSLGTDIQQPMVPERSAVNLKGLTIPVSECLSTINKRNFWFIVFSFQLYNVVIQRPASRQSGFPESIVVFA